ncbi:MAG: type I-C CRISPR-associated protein Cas8c/Csd1 [Armatimonadota bacterium]
MILQQLNRDADALVDLPPPGYDRKPVKWVVHLDSAGTADWPPGRLSGVEGGDQGKEMLIPYRNRAGIKAPPILLADKRSFTWGLEVDGPRAAGEHERYLELLERCARDTGNADVAAVVAFLRSWNANATPLPADFAGGDRTIFLVDGRSPIADTAVQAFWAREVSGEETDAVVGHCTVCGLHTSLARRLPIPLMGLPARAGGVQMVSGDLRTAESFGLAEALSAQICSTCAERAAKAANALIAGDNTHLHIGATTYLFWAPKSDFDVVTFLSDPDPGEVKLLLTSPWRSGEFVELDDSPFHAVAVTVYIARLAFRSYLDTTVGEVQKSLGTWFSSLEMVSPDGSDGTPLGIKRILRALYFRQLERIDFRKEQERLLQPATTALVDAALSGRSLPPWLLHLAVQRCRFERDVTYPRAALIRAALPDLGGNTLPGLNPDHPDAAYQCGRLLALFEQIQLTPPTRGGRPRQIRTTVANRCYGGASTSPRYVLGSLERLARAHLGQMRSGNKGAYEALDRRLEEIHSRLEGNFPACLTAEGQALFALGFYHERADSRRAVQEAVAARNAGDQDDAEGDQE